MKDNSIKIFLILDGLTRSEMTPVQVFISTSRNEAIMFLENYIINNNTKAYYELREIFKIEKKEYIRENIFITSRYNKMLINKIDIKKEKKIIESCKDNDTVNNIIKLFDGKVIKND